jgi:hypothetical protein
LIKPEAASSQPVAGSSRPEAVFVLLLLQAMTWAIAGISAIPFAFGGEVSMLGLGLASLLLALGTCLIAIGILWRRRWARRLAMALECVTILGALALLALPIGANHGLVAWLTNVGLPVAVIVLLRKAF